MIKEALEYVVGLRKPSMVEVEGETYADKQLHHVSFNPKADAIKMSTLTSLVDYIKAGIDTMSDKMIVHVCSPTRVELYSDLDKERVREKLVCSVAGVPEIKFDRFVDSEMFLIGVQSKFIPTDDSKLILKFAGTVEDGTVVQYGDDGVTQKATIKQGPVSKTDAIVPNPVILKPFRTFCEVDQPESQFVFRMQSERGSVVCALFEADGGAWEHTAKMNVKKYLQESLKEYRNFTVIA